VKRLLLAVAFAAACSSGPAGPSRWTIQVSNQWSDSLSVTAWNEANAGQIAQYAYVTVPANSSGCLRIDQLNWGTTIASVETFVPALQVFVRSGFSFESQSNWSWTITTTPPFYSTPTSTFFPC